MNNLQIEERYLHYAQMYSTALAALLQNSNVQLDDVESVTKLANEYALKSFDIMDKTLKG